MGRVKVKENGEWGEWQSVEQHEQAREEKNKQDRQDEEQAEEALWQDPTRRVRIENYLADPQITKDPLYAEQLRARLDGDKKTAERLRLQRRLAEARDTIDPDPKFAKSQSSYVDYLVKELENLDRAE